MVAKREIFPQHLFPSGKMDRYREVLMCYGLETWEIMQSTEDEALCALQNSKLI